MKHGKEDPGIIIHAEGQDFRCVQLTSSFYLNDKYYPIGSWLVKSTSMDYATAMTHAEFELWREKAS